MPIQPRIQNIKRKIGINRTSYNCQAFHLLTNQVLIFYQENRQFWNYHFYQSSQSIWSNGKLFYTHIRCNRKYWAPIVWYIIGVFTEKSVFILLSHLSRRTKWHWDIVFWWSVGLHTVCILTQMHLDVEALPKMQTLHTRILSAGFKFQIAKM